MRGIRSAFLLGAVSLVAASLLAISAIGAEAAPRAVHPQPTLSTTLDPIEVEGARRTDAELESSRAQAQARHDALDRRIARANKRVLASICSGCFATARPPRNRQRLAAAHDRLDDGRSLARPDEANLDGLSPGARTALAR